MKRIIEFFCFILLFSCISFVEFSYSYQAEPTPPTILDLTHNTPIPDYSSCSTAFHSCGAANSQSFTDPFYLSDYCGDPNFYEIFSVSPTDLLFCSETEFPRPIECKSCSCDAGFVRLSGMCVPDAALSCQFGVANFLTGECYPSTCPFGDGTPEDCDQIPHCVESENTTLISGSPNSCECTGGLSWDANHHSCQPPQCNGVNGSPVDSIFVPEQSGCACPSTHVLNVETNTCQKVICDSGEVFVSSRGQCEVAASCDLNETLITSTNVCSPYVSNIGSCAQVFDDNPDPQLEASAKAACNSCVSSGGIPVLFDESFVEVGGGLLNHFRYMQYCLTSHNQVCGSHGGTYDFDLDLCLNADLLSSSSSSNSSSSSSQSSSSSANSGNSNSSSASGGSGGNGGNGGNNGGDGSSGGSGSSAASASSSGNNSSSGAGECDPESKDYLECIAPDVNPLPPHQGTASGAMSIDQINQNFQNRLRNSPIVSSFDKFKNVISVEASECPEFTIDLTDTPLNIVISTDIHCQLMDNIRPVLSIVMFAVFTFLAFRIFASA